MVKLEIGRNKRDLESLCCREERGVMKGGIESWVAFSAALVEERSRRFPGRVATATFLLAGKAVRFFEQPLRHGDIVLTIAIAVLLDQEINKDVI
jgi:hypothetical protein